MRRLSGLPWESEKERVCSLVYFEDVNNAEVQPLLKDLEATLNNKLVILSCPISPLDWRPILRGIRSTEAVKNNGRETQIQIDLTKNGLVEYTFVSTKEFLSEEDMNISSSWFICLVSNALCSVERFRCAAGALGVGFAMQVEIWTSRKLYIVDYSAKTSSIFNRYGIEISKAHFPQGPTLFPNYSLGIRDKFGKVIESVEQDFLNAAGIDRQDKIQVDLFPGSTSRREK